MNKEIISRMRTVKLVTGTNRYSKKEVVPVFGKLPTKKRVWLEDFGWISDWGTLIGLRDATVENASTNNFNIQNFPFVIIDSKEYLRGFDY